MLKQLLDNFKEPVLCYRFDTYFTYNSSRDDFNASALLGKCIQIYFTNVEFDTYEAADMYRFFCKKGNHKNWRFPTRAEWWECEFISARCWQSHMNNNISSNRQVILIREVDRKEYLYFKFSLRNLYFHIHNIISNL